MKTLKLVTVLVLLLIVILGLVSFFKKDSYIGFFYPDASNLFLDVQSESTFETLDECRAWAKTTALEYAKVGDTRETWDYECGKNCNISGGKPYVCEETLN